MARITTIITTFNRPDYLKTAITTVLEQTRAVDEIVVIDDSDRCQKENAAVVAAFGEPHIKLVTTGGRVGSNPARNLGIETASSDYLAFLDDDDRWLPEKAERQAAVLDADSSVGMVYCGWDHLNLDTGEIRKHSPREFLEGELFHELIFKK